MAAPARRDKPVDLYHTAIPGGTNEDSGITIKGGRATWYEPSKIPPRRTRAMNEAGVRFGGALDRMSKAETSDDGRTLTVGSTKVAASDVAMMASLQASDVSAMFELNDLSIWAYLKEWTLERPVYALGDDGQPLRDATGKPMPPTGYEPMPIPETADEYLDFPVETYEALQKAAAAIYAEVKKQGGNQRFTVDAADDPASPTRASAG